MTNYVTVPDVELVAVGIEWPAVPEPATFSLENLVDAMVAANSDPLITSPRVKLGHENLQPGAEGLITLGDHDPYWTGEPAFGSVKSLRLDDDGRVLLGDLVEVPDWMANAIPSAWPNRSIEWCWDVTTEGGKRYSMVITAVSLLGYQQQAVKSLADVQRVVESGPDRED